MEKYMEKLNVVFEKHLNDFKEVNQYLYDNPELGRCEFKSSLAHMSLLGKLGFQVEAGICDMDTAYIASFKSENPGARIAYLSEYDALPGIGHGCGHNILGVASIAAGTLLKEFVTLYGGEVLVIGCPAEETSGGKVDMCKMGVFDDVDVAIIAHPTSQHHYRSGKSQAIEPIQFVFKGRTAHASSAPHEGVNALDGVLNLFSGINALRQQTISTARIHGVISEGGKAANIIPDLAIADFYVRAPETKYLKELVERVKNCARGAALASGTELEIRNYETSFANLVTNQTLSLAYEKNLKFLGIETVLDRDGIGSTDAGDVSHVCPTIHPYFPISKEKIIGHSREFAEKSIGEDSYSGMKTASMAMALTGIEILSSQELLKNIKIEFDSHRN